MLLPYIKEPATGSADASMSQGRGHERPTDEADGGSQQVGIIKQHRTNRHTRRCWWKGAHSQN